MQSKKAQINTIWAKKESVSSAARPHRRNTNLRRVPLGRSIFALTPGVLPRKGAALAYGIYSLNAGCPVFRTLDIEVKLKCGLTSVIFKIQTGFFTLEDSNEIGFMPDDDKNTEQQT